MQNIKLNKKEIIALAIYVFCIIEIVFIFPIQIKKFTSLHSKVKDLSEKLKEAKRDLDSKDAFINAKEKLKLDIVNLDSKIITSADISSVSAFISRKAKENSVELSEIIQSPPKFYKKTEKAKFFYLPIKVKAKGYFHNICHLLNELGEGYYFLETKELTIKSNTPYHDIVFEVVTLLKE